MVLAVGVRLCGQASCGTNTFMCTSAARASVESGLPVSASSGTARRLTCGSNVSTSVRDVAGFTHSGDDDPARAGQAKPAGPGEGVIESGAQRLQCGGLDFNGARGAFQQGLIAGGTVFVRLHHGSRAGHDSPYDGADGVFLSPQLA